MLLDLDGYYRSLVATLQGFVAEGLVDRRETDRLLVAPAVEPMLDLLIRDSGR